MKELIQRLLKGEGELNLLLLEANEYAESYNDTELEQFINNELNGYNSEIPSYRKIKGEIICTIQTAYGIQNNTPIDLSTVSEKVGFDFNIIHIPDGIGFIQDNLKNITKDIVKRQLPQELVSSLNQIVNYNNPNITVLEAFHQFGKSTLQNILTVVREKLIQHLRRLQKSAKPTSLKNVQKESNTKVVRERIDVFVTYAWENDQHNDTVISFVDFLRKKGYNASMDRLKTQEETAIHFKKMMIEAFESNQKIITILSPTYKQKADSMKGGVGFEFSMILDEIETNQNKFIFAHFGKSERDEITPKGIAGREILNLKLEQNIEFVNLHSKLQSKNTIHFTDVSEQIEEIQQKEIKPFKL
ncbi:AbiTii domain-containing protein [Belliella pelovolcani]|uniref:SEFIR domain-containing protein n=1 Tax=Belliella pelovolcani TaxID=529505 RepID=A0A1N7PSF9_9BACT|nr:SEFIR domain-containing protein [Belliella pelovolcani]SIT13490.1 SEFIR domain-containing protein [Belliella pelovolcani]